MKGILAIIIIVNIVLISYMTFFVDPIHKYTYEEYRISVEGENPELEAELKIRIYPENREKIQEIYDGNVDLNYMYEKLYDIVHKYLPVVQGEVQNASVNSLNLYLQNNQHKMLSYLGITNIEQLSRLANNIKNCNIAENEYVYSNYVENSYQESESYDSFDIIANYKTCKLQFRVYVSNNVLTSPMVIFDLVAGGGE